jgi:hypothetical protein
MAEEIDLGARTIEALKMAFEVAVKLAMGGKVEDTKVGTALKGTDFTGLITNAGQAAIAIGGLTQPGKEAAAALGQIAGMLPGQLGTAATGFVNTLESARQQSLKNAQAGIGGLSLFDIQVKSKAAGMEIDQYREALLRSNGALNGIGMTAQQGSERLLSLGNATLNAELKQKDSLVGAGAMTTDTLMKIGVVANYGRRSSLDAAGAADEQSAATRKLARELYEQARLTGKSSEAMAAELEERLKQPEILGAMRQMTDKQRDSYIQNQAALGGMGNTVSGLSATLGINGRMTDQQRYALAAMGPAAADFTRASQMAAKAQTEGEKEQARVAMESAKAKINDYQASSRYQNIMAGAKGPVADASRQLYSENYTRDRQVSAQQQTGLSPTTIAAENRKQSTMELEGNKKDASGAIVRDENQTGQRVFTDAQLRAQQNSAGAAIAINDYSKGLTTGSTALSTFNKTLDLVLGPRGTAVQAAERYKKTLDDITDAMNKLKTATEGDKNKDNTGGPKKPKVTDETPKPLALGTKDAFGDWFGGPSNMLANIRESGPEAVVPKNKISEFMSDITGSYKSNQSQGDSAESASAAPESPAPSGDSGENASLNDVLASLNQLNKTMAQVASHSESISESSNKSVRLAKKSTGNRVAA